MTQSTYTLFNMYDSIGSENECHPKVYVSKAEKAFFFFNHYSFFYNFIPGITCFRERLFVTKGLAGNSMLYEK